VGARSGVPEGELAQAIDGALAAAGLSGAAVVALATLGRRAAEPGVRSLAARRGWELAGFAAGELASVAVPSPSEAVAARAGTPSVAEAAALRAAGPGGVIVASKRVFPRVTVAIANRVPALPTGS